jgi:hypothetical protein
VSADNKVVVRRAVANVVVAVDAATVYRRVLRIDGNSVRTRIEYDAIKDSVAPAANGNPGSLKNNCVRVTESSTHDVIYVAVVAIESDSGLEVLDAEIENSDIILVRR